MATNKTSPQHSDFIINLPKAEIHIHLEGSIQPETVIRLAKRHNMEDRLPSTEVKGLREWYRFTDFSHFIDVYITIQAMLRTPEDFELITYEFGADMAAQNIRYREATFTPYIHTDWLPKKLDINDIFDGLERGRQKAREEFGVEIRWVFDVPRNMSFKENGGGDYDPLPADKTLEFALAGRDIGVVGFGLGGDEVNAPPGPFAHAFKNAKNAGLLSVPHAGETEGPDSVWGAINDLGAVRIGHGVRSIEDKKLMKVLSKRKIPLEINPTSNICLHVYPNIEEHPFRKLDDEGIIVTVNSDDPPLFNVTLTAEYQKLETVFGYEQKDLVRIARNAFEHCGAGQEIKNKMIVEFDAWVADNLT